MNLPIAPKCNLKTDASSAITSRCHWPHNSPIAFFSACFGSMVFCIVLLHLCGGCSQRANAQIEKPDKTRSPEEERIVAVMKLCVEKSYKAGVRDGIKIGERGLWKELSETNREEKAWSGYADAINSIK